MLTTIGPTYFTPLFKDRWSLLLLTALFLETRIKFFLHPFVGLGQGFSPANILLVNSFTGPKFPPSAVFFFGCPTHLTPERQKNTHQQDPVRGTAPKKNTTQQRMFFLPPRTESPLRPLRGWSSRRARQEVAKKGPGRRPSRRAPTAVFTT